MNIPSQLPLGNLVRSENFYELPVRHPSCTSRLGHHLVTVALLGSAMGCGYTRYKTDSRTISTLADLLIGASFHTLLKFKLSDRQWTVINRFFIRWAFCIYFITTQISLNSKDFQEWILINADTIRQMMLGIIGVQGGQILFTELERLRFKARLCCPNLPCVQENVPAISPPRIKIRTLEPLCEDKKSLAIIQLIKAIAVIVFLTGGTLAPQDKTTAKFLCTVGGCYLAGHIIGVVGANLYSRSFLAQPYHPDIQHHSQPLLGFDSERESSHSSRARNGCCRKFTHFVFKIVSLLKQPILTTATYLTGLTTLSQAGPAMIMGWTQGTDKELQKFKFENELEWQPTVANRPGPLCNRAFKSLKEHRSDITNIVKVPLLLCTLAWFIYGFKETTDAKARFGIATLLGSAASGYAFTKLVDAAFKPGESSRFTNSLYFYLIHYNEYLPFLFVYIKHLSLKIGSKAYTSSDAAIIADIGLFSLMFTAGCEQAAAGGSQPPSDRFTPLVKAILFYVITDLFFGTIK